MATRGRELTRAEALAWRRNWSETDLRVIEEWIARLDVTEFVESARRDLISCRTASGKAPMDIHPGYLHFHYSAFPDGVRIPDNPKMYQGLSTLNLRSESKSSVEAPPQMCSKHPWIALAANGTCPDCD